MGAVVSTVVIVPSFIRASLPLSAPATLV